jgi:hypothetical protein
VKNVKLSEYGMSIAACPEDPLSLCATGSDVAGLDVIMDLKDTVILPIKKNLYENAMLLQAPKDVLF